jgi:hypothetical protein
MNMMTQLSRRLNNASLLAGFMFIPALAVAQAPAPAPDPVDITSAAETLAKAPKAMIGNGVLKATIALPDKDKGFYRGVRFDWAGMISSLTYGDQEYYGLWFDQVAPNVRDFMWFQDKVVAGPQTAAVGPVDAYDANDPPGWKEAAPGGTFLKIGVGILRKPTDGANYTSFRSYEVADYGKWDIKTSDSQVEFTHTVSDPASGYGYVYRKVVRLAPGKPVMELEHSLKNTGTKPIVSESFNHNFLTFGGSPTGPGLKVTATHPLATQPNAAMAVNAQVSGNTVTYQKALNGQERFSNSLDGAAPGKEAYDFTVTNAQGAGYRVTSDFPMTRSTLWSVTRTVAVEPFITIEVEPGKSVDWTFTYTYSRPDAARVATR